MLVRFGMVEAVRWTGEVGCGGASHRRRAPVRPRALDPFHRRDILMIMYASLFFIIYFFNFIFNSFNLANFKCYAVNQRCLKAILFWTCSS